MGWWSRIGLVFGVGGATVEVLPLADTVFRGSRVAGSVVVAGGAVDQQILKVTVSLVEHWVTGSGKNRTYHQSVRGQVPVASDLYVGSGYTERFGFEMDLPEDGRCSRRREGWRLAAEAHVRWAIDPRSTAELQVLPQAAILSVQRALRDGCGFGQVGWDGSGHVITYDFRAPERLQESLDGVTIHLSQEGGNVVGRLVVNHQEHGLGDMLRSMVGADRQSVPITVGSAQLLTRQGRPNPEGALSIVQSALSAAGIQLPPG